MVASEGDEPIAVLLGCKRPPETLVHRIAVHPDWRRSGHARHLLTSLSAKLAILGPPKLLAEVPAADAPARALFEACGYVEEARFSDYCLESPPSAATRSAGVETVGVADLAALGALDHTGRRSWERSKGTLLGRAGRLSGLAIASDERIEASVLYAREEDAVAIWSLFAAEGPRGEAAVEVLVGDLAHREAGTMTIPALSAEEIRLDLVEALGFAPVRELVAYGALATPG